MQQRSTITKYFILAFFTTLIAHTPYCYAKANRENHNIHFKETIVLVGDKPFNVQVANTRMSLKRGLMFRKTIYPYDGMLFVLPKPERAQFWMENTSISLDICYFDSNKKLLQVYKNTKPFDTTDLVSDSLDIQYALELPAGEFDKKLHIGDILKVGALKTRI